MSNLEKDIRFAYALMSKYISAFFKWALIKIDSDYLNFAIKSISEMTKYDWFVVAIIVLLPIFIIWLVIMNETTPIKKKKKTVNYASNIKHWWRD